MLSLTMPGFRQFGVGDSLDQLAPDRQCVTDQQKFHWQIANQI